MGSLMVDMHERTIHVGKHFDLILQLLADIMRFPQGRARVHDDVDLDKIILLYKSASMPGHKKLIRTGPLYKTGRDQRFSSW